MKTKTLFSWHVWLGVVSGVFMLVIGASGAVAVFIEEIDWLVTPALRAKTVAGGMPAPTLAGADAIVASVKANYPDDRIATLNLSVRPSFAHVAKVTSKTRGNLDVFIDPVTGKINGDRVYTAAYTSTLRNFIRQLHLRLFMGLWGRVFVGVFGVTLVLSCITGLWIYRGWFRNLFRLRWKTAGYRTKWSDLHKLIGVWSLAFNLVIGVTGAVLGLENLTNQIRSKWLRPLASPTAESRPPTASGAKAVVSSPVVAAVAMLPLNTLLEKARTAFPDLVVRSIVFPSRPTDPLVFRGDVPSPLVQQSHVRRVNMISLEPFTGEVRQRFDGRSATGWDRIYSSFDPLHFGYFGGIPTKIVWFLLGLSPSVLALTGSWMWWKRTHAPRTRREPSPSRPRPSAAILGAGIAVALVGAYILVSRSQGTWALTEKHIEHGLAKPLALALVAFPVTGLFAFLAWRGSRRGGGRFAAGTGLCAVWYLVLVTLFQ